MNLHDVGHILVTSGFWLSGIGVGYVAVRRDLRRFADGCRQRTERAERELRARADPATPHNQTTLAGVDLGPWIERCRKDTR